MITCGGINANLCRDRYSETLLLSCSVSGWDYTMLIEEWDES